SDGIELSGVASTNVFGNYIGLDINGTNAVSNGEDGILVWNGSTTDTLGAASSSPGIEGGNVIAGNNRNGVRNEGSTPSGIALQANLIGLRAFGSVAQKNVADGVSIVGATGTTIGGSLATQRNVISGNNNTTSRGIFVGSAANNTTIQGNYVGTDISGSTA